MKRKIILLMITLLYGYRLFSQVDNQKRDNDFYADLVNELHVDKQISIFNHTSLKIIKKVNLKDERLIWLNIKDTGTSKGQNIFVEKINLSRFPEKELSYPIGTHPFTNKMYEGLNSKPKSFLVLSPIIYSKDKKLAICSVYHWSDPEASSETIYLLEYKSNTWTIIQFLVVAIS